VKLRVLPLSRKVPRPRGPVLFANAILGGAVAFSVLVLIYSIAKSSGWVTDPWEAGINRFHIVAMLGMLFFGATLFLRETWKINFALITVSTGLAIYLAEIIVFVTLPAGGNMALLARHAGIPYDGRTKYQVIKDMRARGVDAVPAVSPNLFLATDGLNAGSQKLYPLGGIANKTTVLCNESGEHVIYQSDEHGFNNQRGLHKKKNIDVALIGDSYVHGMCVTPGEDVAGRLRSEGLRAISLGMRGSGPLIELAILSEYALPLKPRVVLWFYFENDLRDLAEEQSSALLGRYMDRDFSQRLRDRQDEIDRVLVRQVRQWETAITDRGGEATEEAGVFTGWKAVEKMFKLYHLRARLGIDRPSPYHGAPSPLFREILLSAHARIREAGGRMYFVFLPEWYQYAKTGRQEFVGRDEVLSVIRGLSIPMVDFDQVLGSHSDPLSLFPFRRAAHYTSDGYRLLEEQIVMRLKKDGVF